MRSAAAARPASTSPRFILVGWPGPTKFGTKLFVASSPTRAGSTSYRGANSAAPSVAASSVVATLGGHIELDEDPEQAALREAKEESGLDLELLGERPPTTSPGTRALIAPRFLDIHRISDTHEHIGMIYWARPKIVAQASACAALKLTGKMPVPLLAAAEHHDIRWCNARIWINSLRQ